MTKQDPKESRPLMLRRAQWQALRQLAKEHDCAPKLDVHLARLKSAKL